MKVYFRNYLLLFKKKFTDKRICDNGMWEYVYMHKLYLDHKLDGFLTVWQV